MRTFMEKTSVGRRLRAGLPAARRAPAHGEGGFLLIEVIVSSLLVALIVIGTFTGFDVANRVGTAERQHDEAAVLAAASQEQLRSDPASVLAALQSAPHSYQQTVQGTVYTITQSAELRPSGGGSGTCTPANSSRQSGNAYRITSTVKWNTQEKTNRPGVTASSLITPPIGSSLEVDVLSAPGATTGVAGVTVNIKYTPEGSTGTTTQSQTTGNEGCVVFGAIPSNEAEVEIAETPGYVTVAGEPKIYPNKNETIAPNYTTHYTVVYNKAGAIQASFKYKGSSTANHENNAGNGEVAQTVTGDTFVARNTAMELEPNFELGSTSYGVATAIPYEILTSSYKPTATSKTNLFPFTEEEQGYWGVYAGDCTANNPETVTSGAVKAQEKVIVNPGLTTTVNVPMSYTTLNLYNAKEGEVSKAAKPYTLLETTHEWPVQIDNLACKGTKPDDEKEVSYKHTQMTSTGSALGGHLSDPFQPFGKEFTLCLADSETNRTYKVAYENLAEIGGNVSIYLKQKPTSELASEVSNAATEYKKWESEYKAKEAYKGDSGYANKANEAKTEKEKYEAELGAYNTAHEKYETEKTTYTKDHEKYETELKKYTEDKSKYETEKKNYEKAKTKSEKTKYETEYKKYETEYKAAEIAYKKYEGEAETAKTNYKNYESEANSHKTEYEKYKAAYTTDEKQATEYQYYLEYGKDKEKYTEWFSKYTELKAEEKEGAGITVEKGTTCT